MQGLKKGELSKVLAWALASVVQWVECCPAHQNVASSIPDQGIDMPGWQSPSPPDGLYFYFLKDFAACSFLRILQITTPAFFLPVFGLVLIFKIFLGFINWAPELISLNHKIWTIFLNSKLLCLQSLRGFHFLILHFRSHRIKSSPHADHLNIWLSTKGINS